MAIMAQLVGEVYNVVLRDEHNVRALGGTPAMLAARQQATTTTATAPAAATTSSQGSGGGPTSSPLLFFVALGFGVVFTNLWIIVGVKYCFRYNARNRAIRNGEDVDQVNLDNMPTRPHRRRKEKKLMSMEEVNERFPLTKYKAWVANRLSAGLPSAGGVTAAPSRAGSVRDVDGVLPSSPVETKHSINTNTRPGSAASDAVVAPMVNAGDKDEQRPSDKDQATNDSTQQLRAEDVTAAPVGKQLTANSLDDEEEDDHIHTAVPPELLTSPGDSCAICIDTLEDDDDIRGLTCGHAFHAGCLDPWLTSRRACCPLCKADYYTPKPRPEGDAAAEAERLNRRRGESRMNLPQEPRPIWQRILLTTTITPRGQDRHAVDGRRLARPDRRPTDRQAQPATASSITNTTSGPEVVESTTPGQSRWRNPFTGIRVPGRNRNVEQPATGVAEPSPRQLEAGSAAGAVR